MSGLGPRQALKPKGEDAARQGERRRFVLRDGERLLGEHERAEPAAAARAQGGGSAVERQFVRGLDRSAGDRFDVVERKRRGEENARRGRAAGDLADGEKWLAGERVVRLQRRRPPVGHQELAAPAARHRDAVGIGRGEQGAERCAARPHPAGVAATFSRRREKGFAPPLSPRGRGLG